MSTRVHRGTPDHTSVHPDRPINLQIGPITAAQSFHQRSNGSQASTAPVYRASVLTVAKPRASLSSRRRRPLSPPISHIRPSKASKPPQKGRYPHIKPIPGRFHRFSRPVWPEKGRDRRLPPKLQTDDSPSSAINGRQDHHHQNPRHQIYQDRPSVGQKSRRKISPPPTVAARVPHGPPVALS
ncbi:hypothetical protein BDE02_14G156400 [Populus trichocarpa]|nr:hypothetical protein BDE02_14G156400 [Populus trichocarpa]